MDNTTSPTNENINGWGMKVVDYFSPETQRFGMRMGRRMHMQNAPLRFDPDDYFAFFRRHGWTRERSAISATRREAQPRS